MDARCGDTIGSGTLLFERLLSEADTVARGGTELETRQHPSGKHVETICFRSQRFVGVQVDRPTKLVGDLEQHVSGRLDVVLKVRASADQIGTGLKRIAEQRALVCPHRARHRPSA